MSACKSSHSGSHFCPACGQRLMWQCANKACGRWVVMEWPFCFDCGWRNDGTPVTA